MVKAERVLAVIAKQGESRVLTKKSE